MDGGYGGKCPRMARPPRRPMRRRVPHSRDWPATTWSAYRRSRRGGISTFAESKYGTLDYAEVSALPFAEGGNGNVFAGARVKELVRRVQQDAKSSALYLGYPVRLKFARSRSGWEGYFVEPVMLFPVQEEADGGRNVDTGTPILNNKVLGAYNTTGSGHLLDEAIQLLDELGLSEQNGEGPDLDEVFPRLQAIRPEWEWAETIDPHDLTDGPPLPEVKRTGIFNRAVLIKGEKSPYTYGLETELNKLARLREEAYAETALGQWITRKTSDARVDVQPLIEVLPLNSEQRQAVVQGLSRPLTVITGPPGTGKSQVVTSLLINAAWQGKKVLFASKNNKAVDVVETRVNGLGPRPTLLRVGRNEYERQLSNYLTQILAATATKEDEAEYKEHLEIHEKLRSRFDALEKEKASIIALRNEVDRLEQAVESFRSQLGEAWFAACRALDLSVIETRSGYFRTALDEADKQRQRWWSRLVWVFVRKERLHRLARETDVFREVVAPLGVQLPAGVPTDTSLSQWRAAQSEAAAQLAAVKEVRKYFDALARLGSSKSLERIAEEHLQLQRELASNSIRLWERWLRLQPMRFTMEQRKLLSDYTSLLLMIVDANEKGTALDRSVFGQFYSLFPQIINILSCWAVTSLSARKVPFEPGFFDLVIIDEASQCDIASALPLLYRAKQAVVIGDPNQLKHISGIRPQRDRQLLAKHDLIAGYAGWGYAEKSLFDLACGTCGAEDIVSLRDHHRSHADIINFSNAHFYEGRLRVATSYDRLKRPKGEPAVRWIDVKGGVVRPPSGGAVNDTEARAVVAELRRLVVEQGYRGSVGVVSPFRAQAIRVQDLVAQDDELMQRLAAAEFQADTVHRFQGDERDVMIFSPVVSAGIGDGALRFLRSNPHLFNVAITRARAALVVVGDRSKAGQIDVEYLSGFSTYIHGLGQLEEAVSEGELEPGPRYPEVKRPELVSEWERRLYSALFNAGIRARPQYEVEQYILDFALRSGNRWLNIEVDGERYHRKWDGELARRDQIRNQRLIELGWDVMRFWVYQLRDDMDGCVQRVRRWVDGSA